MQTLHWILFFLCLLGLLDAVAAVPAFTQHDIIRSVQGIGTLALITYFSVKFFNPLLSAKERQEPEVPQVEFHEHVSPTVSTNLLPTSTTGSTDNITQHGPLPSVTEEPCIFNTVFAADASDVMIPYPGTPPMMKLTNLTAACNGSIIEIHEFVTVIVADIPEFFQDSLIVDADKPSSSPAAVESIYPNISLGVNIPMPESSALKTSPSSWHLAEVFQDAYQDKRLKPFVESARRKIYLFGSLLNKILRPFLRLLPKGSSPAPMILVSIPAIAGIWSRTRRERRRLVIRYAPLITRCEWLQNLGEIFGGYSAASGKTVAAAPEAGKTTKTSIVMPIIDVEAAVQALRTLVSIIEPPPVTSGYQDDGQNGGNNNNHNGNTVFTDTFEYKFQLQAGIPSQSPAQPVQLPAFPHTRSTKPLVGIVRQFRLERPKAADGFTKSLKLRPVSPAGKANKNVRPVTTHEDENETYLVGYRAPAKGVLRNRFEDQADQDAPEGTPTCNEQKTSEDVDQVVPVFIPTDGLENTADNIATVTTSASSEVASPIKEQSEEIPSEDVLQPSSEPEQQDGAGVDAESEFNQQPLDPKDALVAGSWTSLQASFDAAISRQPSREIRRALPLRSTQLQINDPANQSCLFREEFVRPSIPEAGPGIVESDDDENQPESPLKDKGKAKAKAKSQSRSEKHAKERNNQSGRPTSSDFGMTEAQASDYVEQLARGEIYFAGELGPHAESDKASSSKQSSKDLPSTDRQPASADEQSSATNQPSNASSPQSEEKPPVNADEQTLKTEPRNTASSEPDRTDPSWQDQAVLHLLTLIRERFAVENAEGDMLRCFLDDWGWEKLTDDNIDIVCTQFLAAVAEYNAQEATKAIETSPIELDSILTSSQSVGPPVAPEVLATSNAQVEDNGTQEDDNDSGNGESWKLASTSAPVQSAWQWPDHSGKESDFSASPTGSGPTVWKPAPDAERLFTNMPPATCSGSHRRSILRIPGLDAHDSPSRFGEERRVVRFATNFDETIAVDTHRFSVHDAPAVVQQSFSMELDAEGLDATGAPAPFPPAMVQSLPVVAEAPSQQVELEGVESHAQQETMDGVEEYGETVITQSEACPQQTTAFQQPTPHISLNNGVIFKAAEAQDQEMTMSEAPRYPYISPFNVVPPPLASGQQGGSISRYNTVHPPLVTSRAQPITGHDMSTFEDFAMYLEQMEAPLSPRNFIPGNNPPATPTSGMTPALDNQQDSMQDIGNTEDDNNLSEISSLDEEERDELPIHLQDSMQAIGNADDDNLSEISSLDEEERDELPIHLQEPAVPPMQDSQYGSNSRPAEQNSPDEDGEDDDDEDKRDNEGFKRHLEAAICERFSVTREGTEYQGHAGSGQGGVNGNPGDHGQEDDIEGHSREDSFWPNEEKVDIHDEDGGEQIVYRVADDEDWPEPAELSDEEYGEDDADDADEPDPYGDLMGFEGLEQDGLPSLSRLFHALTRLSQRGPYPAEITEPRRMIVNRHRTYQFVSVEENPWWCNTQPGRDWMTTKWATFRHEHGWRLIRHCHEMVDNYIGWQQQQEAIRQYREEHDY